MNLEIRDFVGKGEQWPRIRYFDWLTETVSYFSGKEQRCQLIDRPIRRWKINWEWLTRESRDKAVEVFNRAHGRFNIFTILDKPYKLDTEGDYLCTFTDWSSVLIAAQTQVQLGKTYYKGTSEEWSENKTRIVPGTTYAPTIKVDGVAKVEGTDFTLDDNTGIITFASAPGAGKVVTADYQYYFPVRFSDDSYADIEHYKYYHSNGGIELIEVVE